MKRTLLTVLVVLAAVYGVMAQRKITMGLLGSGSLNFASENVQSIAGSKLYDGWGGSAGFYFEDHWRKRIRQVVEFNYSMFTGKVNAMFDPINENENTSASFSYSYGIRQKFPIVNFGYLNLNYGARLFLSEHLFLKPAIGLAYPVKYENYGSRFTSTGGCEFGAETKFLSIALGYSQAFKKQTSLITRDKNMARFEHRLQTMYLKVHVPLVSFSIKNKGN